MGGWLIDARNRRKKAFIHSFILLTKFLLMVHGRNIVMAIVMNTNTFTYLMPLHCHPIPSHPTCIIWPEPPDGLPMISFIVLALATLLILTCVWCETSLTSAPRPHSCVCSLPLHVWYSILCTDSPDLPPMLLAGHYHGYGWDLAEEIGARAGDVLPHSITKLARCVHVGQPNVEAMISRDIWFSLSQRVRIYAFCFYTRVGIDVLAVVLWTHTSTNEYFPHATSVDLYEICPLVQKAWLSNIQLCFMWMSMH